MNTNSIIDYNRMSPESRKEAIAKNGLILGVVTNPTPEERMLGLKQNGWAIERINDPTDEEYMVALDSIGVKIVCHKGLSATEKFAELKKMGIEFKVFDVKFPPR